MAWWHERRAAILRARAAHAAELDRRYRQLAAAARVRSMIGGAIGGFTALLLFAPALQDGALLVSGALLAGGLAGWAIARLHLAVIGGMGCFTVAMAAYLLLGLRCRLAEVAGATHASWGGASELLSGSVFLLVGLTACVCVGGALGLAQQRFDEDHL
jgi:hypothetical protein